jgi:hypothetical protein
MTYTLDELFAKAPAERLIVPYENPHYPAVFIARWPGELFASHGDFVRLTEMFDSAMQGLIQGMSPAELAEFFVPHEDADLSTPLPKIPVQRIEDAVGWMERNFPFVHIPWLRPGDHHEILDEDESEFGGLTAHGKAGYFYVFVADVIE